MARPLIPFIALASRALAVENDGVPPPEMTRAREAAVFTAYFENDTLGNTDRH